MRCVICNRTLLRPGTPMTVGGVASVVGPVCILKLRPPAKRRKQVFPPIRKWVARRDERQVEMFPRMT